MRYSEDAWRTATGGVNTPHNADNRVDDALSAHHKRSLLNFFHFMGHINNLLWAYSRNLDHIQTVFRNFLPILQGNLLGSAHVMCRGESLRAVS